MKSSWINNSSKSLIHFFYISPLGWQKKYAGSVFVDKICYRYLLFVDIYYLWVTTTGILIFVFKQVEYD